MEPLQTTRAADTPANGALSWFERQRIWDDDPVMQRIQPKGMPLLFGDEDFEMGESTVHTISAGILLYGLTFHFALRTAYRVFADLNLYYSAENPTWYLSPDVMVVKPPRPLPVELASYELGPGSPAPLLVGEVLSMRTWQQGDLSRKPMVYSDVGVEEYLLADVTGAMLEQRLMLLRRQRDGRWLDEQDQDGGVTSRLGFRVIIEDHGQLRVLDARTGKRYARPEEAQSMADQLASVQEENRLLKEELARRRGTPAEAPPEPKKGKRRRPKS